MKNDTIFRYTFIDCLVHAQVYGPTGHLYDMDYYVIYRNFDGYHFSGSSSRFVLFCRRK